jgi:hypothetical protein
MFTGRFGADGPRELLIDHEGGVVEVGADWLVVHLDRRSHTPVLREAALDQGASPTPWLPGRQARFVYS